MNPTTLLLVLMVGFWMWMIIDCVAHEPRRKVRLTWLAVLSTPPIGLLAAVAYYFGRMLPRAIDRLAVE